ncbi:MAG: PQQ-binding-like beta-propeller repeat protein [Planctomycetota bacterium]
MFQTARINVVVPCVVIALSVAGIVQPGSFLNVSVAHAQAVSADNDQRLDDYSDVDFPEPTDITRLIRQFQNIPLPEEDDFASGHTEPTEELELELTETEFGYEIQFHNSSPIPTPLIANGRLFTGGGFSSTTFHCFDLNSGEQQWAIELSDDGPSTPFRNDDNLYFGTESCTIFGIAMDTGEHKWSWYLGDPLLSAPDVQGNRTVTVYPASELPIEAINTLMRNRDDTDADQSAPRFVVDLLEPTHVAICFDSENGEVIWKHWVDSDCLTAPVIDGGDVFLVSLAGNFYQFALESGELKKAYQLQATSAPVVTSNAIYLTRRITQPFSELAESDVAQGEDSEAPIPEIHETLIKLDRGSLDAQMLAVHDAPYLDPWVQALSDYTGAAGEFEKMNGWGGGGYGGGGGAGASGGIFSVRDDEVQDEETVSDQQDDPFQDEDPSATPATSSDDDSGGASVPDGPQDESTPKRGDPDYRQIDNLLGFTEVQAAENIGMGSVSTIQGYNGSRPILNDGRLFSTMGDSLVCASAEDGTVIWESRLDGEIEQLGGHLASVPALYKDRLLVATYQGELFAFDQDNGERQLILKFEETTFRFPPLVEGDTVVLTSQDGRLICLDMTREQLRLDD